VAILTPFVGIERLFKKRQKGRGKARRVQKQRCCSVFHRPSGRSEELPHSSKRPGKRHEWFGGFSDNFAQCTNDRGTFTRGICWRGLSTLGVGILVSYQWGNVELVSIFIAILARLGAEVLPAGSRPSWLPSSPNTRVRRFQLRDEHALHVVSTHTSSKTNKTPNSLYEATSAAAQFDHGEWCSRCEECRRHVQGTRLFA
jgi:hypothetical protein